MPASVAQTADLSHIHLNTHHKDIVMQIEFVGLLALLFIVLKLTGVIAWSWFWVLSPLWLGALVWIIVLVAIFYHHRPKYRRKRK